MASAPFGNKSIISSEIFRYVFLHANVSYVDALYSSDSNLNNNSSEAISNENDTNEYAHSCLNAVMAAFSKDDEHNETCGGMNSYKTPEGKVVFLTQAELYCHRGPVFADYSQLEFESVVQLQDKTTPLKNTKSDCGQKPRPILLLGVNHPLYSSDVAVICMKNVHTNVSRRSPPLISRKIDQTMMN